MRLTVRTTSSPTTRLVSVYYVVTIALGAFVLFFHGKLAFAIDLVAVVLYLAMTAAFYDSSKRGVTVTGRRGGIR
jgi:hypothetical protein